MRPWDTADDALATDLYELTMAQGYFQAGKAHEHATFSLFSRKYPPHRGYFVACGLEDVVDYLEGWQFHPQAIDYLHQTGLFADDFLAYLKGIRNRKNSTSWWHIYRKCPAGLSSQQSMARNASQEARFRSYTLAILFIQLSQRITPTIFHR